MLSRENMFPWLSSWYDGLDVRHTMDSAPSFTNGRYQYIKLPIELPVYEVILKTHQGKGGSDGN